eukprot:m.151306 g.151306  ORF g.151306 m.151306 type:complete len:1658 (-) comp30751_c2_seq14:98-5071(-)
MAEAALSPLKSSPTSGGALFNLSYSNGNDPTNNSTANTPSTVLPPFGSASSNGLPFRGAGLPAFNPDQLSDPLQPLPKEYLDLPTMITESTPTTTSGQVLSPPSSATLDPSPFSVHSASSSPLKFGTPMSTTASTTTSTTASATTSPQKGTLPAFKVEAPVKSPLKPFTPASATSTTSSTQVVPTFNSNEGNRENTIAKFPYPGRDDSDDEADAMLGEAFPKFYYGGILKFAELGIFDGFKQVNAKKRPNPLAQLIETMAIKRRKVEGMVDQSDKFEDLEVDFELTTSHAFESDSDVDVDGDDNDADDDDDDDDNATSDKGGTDSGNSPSDSNADANTIKSTKHSKNKNKNAIKSDENAAEIEKGGDTDEMYAHDQLLNQMEWEKSVIWDSPETANASDNSTTYAVPDINLHRKRRLSEALRRPIRLNTNPDKPDTTEDKGKEKAPVTAATTTPVSTAQEEAILKQMKEKEMKEKAKQTKQKEDEAEAIQTDVIVKVAPEDCTSLFAAENEYLKSGKWENAIQWDDDPPPAGLKDENICAVNIDLNDFNALYGTTVERPIWMRPPKRFLQLSGRNRVPTWELRMKEKDLEEWKLNLAQNGLPVPNHDKDIYNISNDNAYAKAGVVKMDLSLKESLDKPNVVEHSVAGRRLDPLCFRTDWTESQRRNFHRDPLQKEKVASAKYALKQKTSNKYWRSVVSYKEAVDDVTGKKVKQKPVQLGKPWKAKDIHALDGEIAIAEYCEEFPLLVAQRGMCTQIRNYYQQKDAKDTKSKKFKYGQNILVGPQAASPFMGDMEPGKNLQSFENNMFRAPIYQHKPYSTDFLIIRKNDEDGPDMEEEKKRNPRGKKEKDKGQKFRYYIRPIETLYTVGQLCPKIEVPKPHSKYDKEFMNLRLLVHIKRLFLKDRNGFRKSIRVEDVKRAFPTGHYTETMIRSRMKDCATFNRKGEIFSHADGGRRLNENGAWEWNEDRADETQKDLELELPPDLVCAYESMLAGKQRLADMGYSLNAKTANEELPEDDNGVSQADELRVAPWELTSDFRNWLKGKGSIYVSGKDNPGDPTGPAQAGFSYVRVPHKTAPGTINPNKQGRLAGTNADLRRLLLPEAKRILIEDHGYSADKLKGMGRWEIVRRVENEKSKEVEANDTEHRYYRPSRTGAADQAFTFQEKCDDRFMYQNHSLTREDISTDEDESDEEYESEPDDDLLYNVARAMGKKKGHEISKEKQEKIALQGLKDRMLNRTSAPNTPNNNNNAASSSVVAGSERAASTVGGKSVAGDTVSIVSQGQTVGGTTVASGVAERTLVIIRTVHGRKYKEKVVDPDVINEYLKAQEKVGRTPGSNDDHLREIKKEKLRLEAVKKRLDDARKRKDRDMELKRLDERGDGASSPTTSVRSFKSDRSSGKSKGKKTVKNMKCSRCGELGHTRSNKRCPRFMDWDDSSSVGGGFDLPTVEEGVTELVGTSLKLNISKMNKEVKATKTAVDSKKHQKYKRDRERMLLESDDFDSDLHTLRNSSRSRKNPGINLNNILAEVLAALKNFDRIQPFRKAVDKGKWPSYYVVIKHPMDMGKIQEKIYATDVYTSRHEFLDDIRLIAANALQFNGHQHQFYKDASDLRDLAIDELVKKDERLKECEEALNTYKDTVIDKDKEIDLCFDLVERNK